MTRWSSAPVSRNGVAAGGSSRPLTGAVPSDGGWSSGWCPKSGCGYGVWCGSDRAGASSASGSATGARASKEVSTASGCGVGTTPFGTMGGGGRLGGGPGAGSLPGVTARDPPSAPSAASAGRPAALLAPEPLGTGSLGAPHPAAAATQEVAGVPGDPTVRWRLAGPRVMWPSTPLIETIANREPSRSTK